jgi:hypothetical protein
MISLFEMLIVMLVGLAGINALLSYITIASCRVLDKAPEIDRPLDKLHRSSVKTEKYPWSGPKESSRLAVIVIWIIFLIGLAFTGIGLLFTGRVQEYFFVFGIAAFVLSVAANLSVSLFVWFVIGKMQEEKKKLADPFWEEKEKKKKKRKFFGISFHI